MFKLMLYLSFLSFSFSSPSSSSDSSQLVLNNLDYSTHSTCPSNPPTSCHLPPNNNQLDTCCTDSPGGQILLTQFWDFHPATGPADSWTIHGLWPDKCDGTYEASCDSERLYSNITDILKKGGGNEALEIMNEFWKDQRGNDEQFWQHEWNKHGTCISTLQPKCFGPNYVPQSEVVAFFNRTVNLFTGLPTYEWLKESGIIPSVSQTYTLKQLQDVANKHFGQDAIWNCRGHSLNEVWWHHNTVGTTIDGKFVPAKPVGPLSTCPQSGIQYIPKTGGGGGGGEHRPHRPHNPTPKPTNKHFINVIHSSDERKGCLIGTGAWYTHGTCARYTIKSFGDLIEISTRKGNCGFNDKGNFECGHSGIHTKGFSLNSTFILHEGQQIFFAGEIPNGRTQIKIKKSVSKESVQLELGPVY
ncbi:hypothetical protein CROQUDRAFT_724007 [Cronartium quercuum f. sp. fusiforme G11]|uniref:Ribonuclease T2-like n=1 Tax=Cronartium quercuum f. sp. fusiforme G11 TaxID=708437 RepID=A0A9P6ND03_9BASI|nr:hypothetical protein CROQUDRAFT_724007 [Cronartium quercuum f. sp. fusiforme G11]